ncbi:MAG TPA: hypothetical protein VNV17_24770, partial [Solirubrobacteraceae bacterium]|nr:hypothetical protein [Solirubrobacteraceae bacterium]
TTEPTTTTGTTTTATTSCPTTTTGTTSTTTPTTGTTGDCTSDGTTPGGGQVGAVVISRYVKANSADAADTFNHFSLLKTIEDLFSVQKLGYAKDTSLPEFDTVVFNNFTAG